MTGSTARKPRWVLLPDTRPTEWPWESMMPEDWVVAVSKSGLDIYSTRLRWCWPAELDAGLLPNVSHVCPRDDFKALLPGGGE